MRKQSDASNSSFDIGVYEIFRNVSKTWEILQEFSRYC